VKQGISRIAAACWMLLGFIAMACIIGALASGLSASRVDSLAVTPEGLMGVETCTYEAYVNQLQAYGPILVPPLGVSDIHVCWDMLKAGTVKAVVYEEKNALASRRQHADLHRFSIGSVFETFDQGGLVSSIHRNTEVESALNWAIGKLMANHVVVQELDDRWIGKADHAWFVEETVQKNLSIPAFLLWTMFFALQLLSMNNPWVEALREKLPDCWGLHEFLFGTNEERLSYAKYNANMKDKWHMFCPERLKPKPTDDQGVFSTQNPNGVMEGEYGAEDHQDTDCSAVVKITNSALDREEAEGTAQNGHSDLLHPFSPPIDFGEAKSSNHGPMLAPIRCSNQMKLTASCGRA